MWKKSVSIPALFLCLFSVVAEIQPLRFNHYNVENGLSQNTILSISEDKYGYIWLGTLEGINRFDGYQFKTFRAEEDNPNALTNNRINAITLGDDGFIWIQSGDEQLIFRYDYSYEKFVKYNPQRIPSDVKKKFANYSDKKKISNNSEFSWIATENGLLQKRLDSEESICYRADKNNNFTISDNLVTTTFIDRKNNLWVGTQSGGVHVTGLQNNHFKWYTLGSSGLSENAVRAISLDPQGRIWLGTEANGIAIIDRKAKNTQIEHINPLDLIDHHIRELMLDSHQQMWVGTKGGLMRFDTPSGRFKKYFAKTTPGLNDPYVFSITEDRQGTIWVGTFEGFARYDRKMDNFIAYDPNKYLKSAKVRAILEGKNGDLWVATEYGGVTRLRRTKGDNKSDFVPTHFEHLAGNSNSLINNMVLALAEDKKGNIWIGTNSGLCMYDINSGNFTRFSTTNGFPDDLIMGLQTDKKGDLWISHKKGLTCLNTMSHSFRSYNRYDGLQGNEFTQNASFKDENTGELFFGGINGINSFFPEQIQVTSHRQTPVFTGLKILNKNIAIGEELNGRVILEKSLQESARIKLDHRNNNFSISFSLLNYSNPQGCHYKYRLNGIDKEWIVTDASVREATYTYLPAGNYTLEVYASNSNGEWSELPAKLQIEVMPAWWLSIWAKIIYLTLVLLLLWFVYRFLKSKIEYRNQIRYEQLKMAKNEELTNLKLQFFTEISHELRTPVTLLMDPLEQLMKDSESEQTRNYLYGLMHKNGSRLLELINQLLDFRKLQSGKLQLQCSNIELIALIAELKSAFDKKANDKKIRFLFEHNVEQMWVCVDPDKFQKIIINLIANAFRFTPEYGEIILHASYDEADDNLVKIEVRDNGLGISQDQYDKIFETFYQVGTGVNQPHSSGLGLALTKELVLLHGGTITVAGEKGKGATFTLRLPITQPMEWMVDVDSAIKSTMESPTDKPDTKPDRQDQAELPLVLIVDDEQDIRNYLQLQLSKEYRIATAESGVEAFNKATELIPDLIVSDLMMPGIDGIELCRRLKKHELTSHIPVVLLTARQSDESRIEGYETGADAYIVKPFNSRILLSRMANLLVQRKSLRKFFSENREKLPSGKISVNVTDEVFLNKVVTIILENIENPDFEPDMLSEKLKISRSQLYRKLRALTNRSVHDFIISVRMSRAREILLEGELSISETAYKVGYSLPTNFTRTFTKHYGMTPKKYIDHHKK